MKPVEELLAAAHATLSTSSTMTTGEPVVDNVTPLNTQARKAVRRVFATLKTAYPAWYEKHFGIKQAETLAKRVWMTGIKSLTDAQVDRGLQRMVLDADYPPSLRDFVKLCRRVDGLPSVESAWYEALEQRYSHEVVKVASALTGTFELHHYAIVIRRLENGEPLDGKVEMAIGFDAKRPPGKIQHDFSERQLRERIAQQGIPTSGAAARAQLMAKLHIGRDTHA
jgi:hypothetical protein